jgi:uncharacterized protein
MIRRLGVLAVWAVCSTSCFGSSTPAPTAPPGGVVVRFGEHTVGAEIADAPDERRFGLMNRRVLGENSGMLFLFAERRSGGFWMKNTLIPLSIAFMRSVVEGTYEVAAVLHMQPCQADPCRVYDPKLSYDAALEVNRGWFEQAQVAEGDVAKVEGRLPSPP